MNPIMLLSHIAKYNITNTDSSYVKVLKGLNLGFNSVIIVAKLLLQFI